MFFSEQERLILLDVQDRYNLAAFLQDRPWKPEQMNMQHWRAYIHAESDAVSWYDLGLLADAFGNRVVDCLMNRHTPDELAGRSDALAAR